MSNIPFPDVLGHLKTYAQTVIDQDEAYYDFDASPQRNGIRIEMDTRHHAVIIDIPHGESNSKIIVIEKATCEYVLGCAEQPVDGPSFQGLMEHVIRPMGEAKKLKSQMEDRERFPGIGTTNFLPGALRFGMNRR